MNRSKSKRPPAETNQQQQPSFARTKRPRLATTGISLISDDEEAHNDSQANRCRPDAPFVDTTAQLTQILREKFRLTTFRPQQAAVMNAILNGRDALVVMLTGHGKSVCFQAPAVLSTGVTLVVSPLRSLIADQLAKLRSLGIAADRFTRGLAFSRSPQLITRSTTSSSSGTRSTNSPSSLRPVLSLRCQSDSQFNPPKST